MPPRRGWRIFDAGFYKDFTPDGAGKAQHGVNGLREEDLRAITDQDLTTTFLESV